MLRIAVKNIYFTVMRKVRDVDTVKVLIYGSDQNAVMAKQALESSTESRFVIVGFIDTHRGKLNSYIERKRVYHIKDLAMLKQKYAIDKLILVKEYMGQKDKKLIVERCLRVGIKVLTVPPATEWVSGRLKKQQIKNLRIEDLLERPPSRINNAHICDDLCGKRILITRSEKLSLVKEYMGQKDKQLIVERCLRVGIKMLTVPPATEWVSGRLKKQQIKNLRIEDLLERPPIRINNAQICDDLCGKRILITGAAGSIGSEIVRQVLKYEPQMLVLCDQAESPMHEIQLEIEEKFPASNVNVVIA